MVEYAAGDHMAKEGTAIRLDLTVLAFASIAVFVVGLLVGVIELFVLKNSFTRFSFAPTFLFKVAIYLALMSLVILITFPIAASLELDTNVMDPAVWEKYVLFLGSRTHMSTLLQMGVSLSISLFYSEISKQLGHRFLLYQVTGRYHRPLHEERVFMFVDMRASTTIAEQLGHIRYFELLKDYFRVLTDPIIDHDGEIYQYVGDEVIITWPLRKRTQVDACLHCFFSMEQAIKAKATRFEQLYGLCPQFKAGAHLGEVTTGEIGELKTDITFSGDVLNTTARIQSLCNVLNTDLLISTDLKERVQQRSAFNFQSVGEVSLRGREEKMALFSVAKRP